MSASNETIIENGGVDVEMPGTSQSNEQDLVGREDQKHVEEPGSDQDQDDENNLEEAEHFAKVIAVFKNYGHHALRDLKRDTMIYMELPERQRKMLHPTYTKHLAHVRLLVKENHRLLQFMLSGVGQMFENSSHSLDEQSVENIADVSAFQMEKLQSSLRQIVRDWSSEGACERDQCYQPIVAEIDRRFSNVGSRSEVRILVPGAGLSRLAWQFAKSGYTCQGNEFSLYMLFMSNFILNRCKQVNGYTIYPYIHQRSNSKSYADQLRPIQFPDVDPTDLPKDPQRFSMAAGEFLEVYDTTENLNTWDAITTVFFIDTAHNIIDYLECLYRILKPGGVWINLGPLLYHFADMPNEDSIELPVEEIRRLIELIGFRIEREQLDVPTSYTQNQRSMLQYEYKSVFLVCVKPEVAVTQGTGDK